MLRIIKFFIKTGSILIASFYSNAPLIWQFGKRQIAGRYRGSFFGIFWSFINPLLLLSVYALVFGFIFQAKFGLTMAGGKADFAIILFSGLIIHQFFAECLIASPNLIVNNTNYVKKVIFPLEILPWATMLSALFHLGISLLVLLIFAVCVNPVIHWTVILFPIVIFPLVLLTMGVAWFLCALGVFLRDMGQFIGFVVTICLFLSPTFYSITSIPLPFRNLLYLNPITIPILGARDVILFGNQPNWEEWGIYTICAIVIAILGLGWFQKTRHLFADVL